MTASTNPRQRRRRIGEAVAESSFFLLRIFSRSVADEITAVNDVHRAFRAHYGDFSCRPRVFTSVRMCLEAITQYAPM